jgi:hypothetical protein
LVWVNPPNRIKYTVIRRVRNVRRYVSLKCSTNRDGKRRDKFQISSFKHQGTSNLERLNGQTRDHAAGAFEILWNWILELGIPRRIANSARLDGSRELQ